MRRSMVSVVFVLIALCASTAPGGHKPGDWGSVECRQAQIDAQVLVAVRGPFRNHGHLGYVKHGRSASEQLVRARSNHRTSVSSFRREISWRSPVLRCGLSAINENKLLELGGAR